MRAASERGSGTAMAAAAAFLVVMIAVAVMAVGVVIAAQHRLAGAADLVAVSAATARAGGEDPCAAARRIAAANDAALTACDAAGDILDFVVTVEVAAPLVVPLLGAEYELTATANAGWLSDPG